MKIEPLKQSHPPEKIITARLILQRQSVNFAEQHYEAINRDRDRLGRYMTHVSEMTLELEREFLIKLERLWDCYESIDYAAFCRQSGRLVGCIGTPEVNWKNHRVEIGYMLFSPFEGQGFAQEAVSQLVTQLFALGFHRVFLRCNAKNDRSRRLAAALGFELEGILASDCVENGVFRDTCVYAKISSF
jgi:RimJ/RimL family protein N-acetyltransferase